MSEDVIRVVPATHDPATGQPLEPEERPAEVATAQRVPLTLGLPGQEVSIQVEPLTVASETSYQLTVGELAQSLRKRCATCAYFDNAGWLRMKHEYERSSRMEHRQFVNDIRATVVAALAADEPVGLLADEDDGVEQALAQCGICRAISEIFSVYTPGDPFTMVVFAMTGCPDQMRGPGDEDLSRLYRPRDRAAARAAGQAQDVVLRMAEGRVPDAH